VESEDSGWRKEALVKIRDKGFSLHSRENTTTDPLYKAKGKNMPSLSLMHAQHQWKTRSCSYWLYSDKGCGARQAHCCGFLSRQRLAVRMPTAL